MLRYGLLMLALCFTSLAEGNAKPGKTQKVIYPNGRVVYEAVKESVNDKPVASSAADVVSPATSTVASTGESVANPEKAVEIAAAPAPTITGGVSIAQSGTTPTDASKPCDGCGGGTTPDSGKCRQGLNEPHIIPGSHPDCQKDPVCTPKDNTPDPNLPEVPGGNISFYTKCINFKGKANVPVLQKNSREEYVFDRVPFTLKCCTYEVCVVTKCCCVDTKDCVLKEQNVNLKVCFRTSGLVDVYVVNQPGMPKEWVLYLGIPMSTYESTFPGGPKP